MNLLRQFSVLQVLALALLFSSFSFASPAFNACVSDDGKVNVAINSSSSGDDDMLDMKINVSSGDKSSEANFPVRENSYQEKIVYTLSDSEIELLTVDLATQRGKLWRGQMGGPNPYVDVICTK